MSNPTDPRYGKNPDYCKTGPIPLDHFGNEREFRPESVDKSEGSGYDHAKKLIERVPLRARSDE